MQKNRRLEVQHKNSACALHIGEAAAGGLEQIEGMEARNRWERNYGNSQNKLRERRRSEHAS